MDFLDPKAKNRRTIRLFTGYFLVGVLILIATTILVFNAYGFNVNRKTGEVIQNGLVYVDSAPDGATIRFNGKEHKDKTNTRVSLEEGKYDLSIYKNDYRDWHLSFELEGGEVQRLTYPLLIPKKLDATRAYTYDVAPTFVTQSPDRRWVLSNVASSMTSYVVFDLNTLNNKLPTQKAIVFPADLFTRAEGAQSLELVEWSNDNKHVLVKHTFAGGQEFVVLNHEKPGESLNVNKLLNQNPSTMSLIDKKFDKWYLLNSTNGQLATADAKTKQVTPIISGVGTYKSHGDDTILYSSVSTDGKYQRILLKEGKNTYQVREISAGTAMLDIARYDNAWYVVIGSDTDKKTYVYKNPQAVLARNDQTKPVPSAVLRSDGPLSKVSFSSNTRFVAAQSGQHFEVYDAEYKKLYKFDEPKPIDQGSSVTWMDGHRFAAKSGGKWQIFDFNGANVQELVPELVAQKPIFNRDYNLMYSLQNAQQSPGKVDFIKTNLRTTADQ